ncbi:hypothetical protein ACC684_14195 [Rhizobium ruizarguesonis]|uniref:hypothetical protein n=1 Tax=Rhizobium ruizarguesonis TaxID=2081791 RepID=UPI001FE21284|nr:hypothetical protein [Rhizobium ruizarguesonis]
MTSVMEGLGLRSPLNSVAGSPDGWRVVATSMSTCGVLGVAAVSATGCMTPLGCPQAQTAGRRTSSTLSRSEVARGMVDPYCAVMFIGLVIDKGIEIVR